MLVLHSFLSLKLHLLYHYLFATHFQILLFTERKKQSENISNEKKVPQTHMYSPKVALNGEKTRETYRRARQPFALFQSC